MNNLNKKKLLNYLTTQPTMSLATSNGSSLWSATVYFIADEDLNFYFMSGPKTIHAKNIASKANVSLTVAQSDQWPQMDKYGIQASGKASSYKNIKGLIGMLKIWNAKFVKKPAPPLGQIKLGWPFYKITINRLKIFDNRAKISGKLYKINEET